MHANMQHEFHFGLSDGGAGVGGNRRDVSKFSCNMRALQTYLRLAVRLGDDASNPFIHRQLLVRSSDFLSRSTSSTRTAVT